jgi:hypothetical protein
MEYSSQAIRGLKLGAIRDLRRIVASRNFSFCIAHRFKPVYIALLATRLPVIGVHHAFGDYQRRSRKLFAHLFRQRLSLLGVSDAVRDDMRKSGRKSASRRCTTASISNRCKPASYPPRRPVKKWAWHLRPGWSAMSGGCTRTRIKPRCCADLPRRCRICPPTVSW